MHAYQVGEHGDTELTLWSTADIGGQNVTELLPYDTLNGISDFVKNEAYDIIEKKGATYYGIAMSVKRICEAIVRDEKTILPVSSIQHDNHGISDVALSMPAIVGKDGVECTVPISLNDAEIEALRASADTLKNVIKDVL